MDFHLFRLIGDGSQFEMGISSRWEDAVGVKKCDKTNTGTCDLYMTSFSVGEWGKIVSFKRAAYWYKLSCNDLITLVSNPTLSADIPACHEAKYVSTEVMQSIK